MWSKKHLSTYSVRKITEWLDQQGFSDYSRCNPRIVDAGFVTSGIRLGLGDIYELSIQTHPMIASYAFAETAIKRKDNGKLVYISKYGYYGDVIRHDDTIDLFNHIQLLMQDIKNYTEDDESVEFDWPVPVPVAPVPVPVAPVPVPVAPVPVPVAPVPVPIQEENEDWNIVGKHGRIKRSGKA
jgi:hypothetical protein